VSDLNLSNYDLVFSSSSGYVKGVQTSRDAVHVCYCHTPMRWAWNFDSYSQRESFGIGKRALLQVLVRALRLWDVGASRQPDHFIANSKVVAERIQRAYGRSAEVIHPPIDTQRFRPSGEDPEDYYVVLSRLIPYKRIDLAVQACSELGRKLYVIGAGPGRDALEASAGPTVKFLGRASDADVEHLVARCRALLFPGEEDFGMAPLEVAAAGRPTIAYRGGGALETIVENETGVFFDQQTPTDLAGAIERFERQHWNPEVLARHAEGFGVDIFQDRVASFLRRVGIDLPALPPLFKSTVKREANALAAHG
jgi:glycosyltransferase involved in cell wall biosynthesis